MSKCYTIPLKPEVLRDKLYLVARLSTAGGLSRDTVLSPVTDITPLVVLAGTTGDEERRGECVVGGVLWPLGELLRDVWWGPADACFFTPAQKLLCWLLICSM